MDLLAMTRQLKPVRGQRLAKWLERFLTAHPDQLDQWSGHFTEVVTAKAIAIYRRRGVVEELEVQGSRFSALVNAAYRAVLTTTEAETSTIGELLMEEMRRIENERGPEA